MESPNEDIAGNKRLRISHFKRPNCSTPNANNVPGSNSRIDKDLSPTYAGQLHPNHSPSSLSNNLRPYSNHGYGSSSQPQHHTDRVLSPQGTNGMAQRSPSNFPTNPPLTINHNGGSLSNRSESPQYVHHPDDIGGHFPPYQWSGRTENHHENGYSADPGKLPDSDETDSVDSGNGSTSSISSHSSIHHTPLLPAHVESVKSYQMDYTNGNLSGGTYHGNGKTSPGLSTLPLVSVTEPSLQIPVSHHEESSLTNGHGLSSQQYPESQVETSQKKQKQLKHDDRSSANGNKDLNGHSASNKERERARERTRDKDTRKDREGKRDKDRDRERVVNKEELSPLR